MPAEPETFQSLIHYSQPLGCFGCFPNSYRYFVCQHQRETCGSDINYRALLISKWLFSWNAKYITKYIQYILEWKSFAARTQFLGLSVSVVLQFAEEGVLLGQQHFDVLHTHSDYPGANVRLESVDTLVGQRRDVVDNLQTNILKPRLLTVTRRIKNELIIS